MKLSAPKQTVWLVAVILGVLGILGNFVSIPMVTTYAFWLVAVGFAALALGTAMKGV
jgi:hypothetical protein